MDPPALVNEASFTAASNPSSYSLVELLSRYGGGGIIGDIVVEESTVTHLTDDATVKRKSHYTSNQDLNESNSGKRFKATWSGDGNGELKKEAEANSGTSVKPVDEKPKPEPLKDYIHVRARRGQATDSHSLAERARRERITERMKILQDLVPGCNKVIGKAMVLDEIINYIQSLQGQVEFLSLKLEAVNSRMHPSIECFPAKELVARTFDTNQMIFGLQTPKENYQGTEWLHIQVGSTLERAT